MRTTIINIEPDDFKQLAHNTDIAELTEAIGYLATWGMAGTGYDKVQIRITDKCDLLAYYTCEDNPSSYFIMGGIWHNDTRKFTYHS